MIRPRTLKDLQNHLRVDSIHHEHDSGWWCYLKAGFQDSSNPQCHTIHEQTIREVCELVDESIVWPDDPELELIINQNN